MDTRLLNANVGTYAIREAADILHHGGVVAFPTETVYGLGADMWNSIAVDRVFQAKGRPQDNPLIVHVASKQQVLTVASSIPPMAQILMDHFWPGPLTLVLHKKSNVPQNVTAGLDTVCVRMPADPVALQLIQQVKAPLVAPSANRSGKPSPTTAEHVLHDLEGRIDAVIDGGECMVGIESTVVDVTGDMPRILRPGMVTAQDIAYALGIPISHVVLAYEEKVEQGIAPVSPGMKYKHYAPDSRIEIIDSWNGIDALLEKHQVESKNIMVLSNAPVPHVLDGAMIHPLAPQSVYGFFREADSAHTPLIIIFIDESVKRHAGLMNRITKAAGI